MLAHESVPSPRPERCPRDVPLELTARHGPGCGERARACLLASEPFRVKRSPLGDALEELCWYQKSSERAQQREWPKKRARETRCTEYDGGTNALSAYIFHIYYKSSRGWRTLNLAGLTSRFCLCTSVLCRIQIHKMATLEIGTPPSVQALEDCVKDDWASRMIRLGPFKILSTQAAAWIAAINDLSHEAIKNGVIAVSVKEKIGLMAWSTAAIFGLPPHFCAVPLAAPEPQWGGYWGQGRRVRAKIRPPSSRKQLAGHCRAAAAR